MSSHRRRSHRDFAEMSGFEIELPSSPDPLADEAENIDPDASLLPPPSTTRRILPSSVSTRFSALPGTSPRKRMFALDVGNEITPQTIYVTVEAGSDGNPITKVPLGSSVRRRLFGSPTAVPGSSRRVRTTTTTVPLRGLTDDEADPTPKRRRRRSSGRPGTPAAASSTKQRKLTPPAKVTKKTRSTPKPSAVPRQDLAFPSGTPGSISRPTPAKRGRPPKRKPEDDPSAQGDPDATQTLPRKRGRKSRVSLGPDDFERMVRLSHDNDEAQETNVQDPKSPIAPVDILPARFPERDSKYDENETHEDLWLGAMSDRSSLPRSSPLRSQSSPRRMDNTSFSEVGHALEVNIQHEPDEHGPFSESLSGILDGHHASNHVDNDGRKDRLYEPEDEQPIYEGDPSGLIDQGASLSALDHYAPLGDNMDRSDTESQHSAQVPTHKIVSPTRDERQRPDGTSNPEALIDQGPLSRELNDYGSIRELSEGSDAPSHHSEQSSEPEDTPEPTVDPDTFTMIGIDSLVSFRPDKSHVEAVSDSPGEGNTNIFIANPPKLVKREVARGEDDKRDKFMSRDATSNENNRPTPKAASLSAQTRSSRRETQSLPSSEPAAPSDACSGSRSGRLVLSPSSEQVFSSTAPIDHLSDEENLIYQDEDDFSDIPEEVLAAAESPDDWQPSMNDSEEQVDLLASFSENLVVEQGSSIQNQAEMAAVAATTAIATVTVAPLQANWQHRKGVSEEVKNDLAEPISAAHTLEPASSHPPHYSLEQTRGPSSSTQSTPLQPHRSPTDDNATISQASVPRSTQSGRGSEQDAHRNSQSRSLRSPSSSIRPLTPDETSSSSHHSPPAHQAASNEEVRDDAPEDVGSSPPEMTNFVDESEGLRLPARRISHTQADQVPDVHTEPTRNHPLHRPPQLPPPHLVGPRPTLSPVVRIGRTLQNILSDPPSPSAHSLALGSPFKGSARNSSPLDGTAGIEASQSNGSASVVPRSGRAQSVPHAAARPAPSPSRPRTTSFAPLSQIKNLVMQGAQLLTSPHSKQSLALDDPFGPSSPTTDRGLGNSRGLTFMERIRQASREGSVHSNKASGSVSNGDDGKGMFRAPDVPSTSRSKSFNIRGLSSSRSMGLKDGLRKRERETDLAGPYDSGELVHDERNRAAGLSLALSSEQPQSGDKDDLRDEGMQAEDDEALASDARIEQRGFEGEDDENEFHGEDVHTDGQNVETGDEEEGYESDDARVLRQDLEDEDEEGDVRQEQENESHSEVERADDQNPDDEDHEDDDEEDIWAIEANRTASSPEGYVAPDETLDSFKKNDLSVDWGTNSHTSLNNPLNNPGINDSMVSKARRSVREPPVEDLDQYSMVDINSGSIHPSSARKPTPATQKPLKRVDLSDFFSSSPNFIERQNRAKQALLAKPTNKKPAITAPQAPSPKSMSRLRQVKSATSQNTLAPIGLRMSELPSPVTGASQATNQESTTRTEATSTPERVTAPRPHQKDSTPGRGQNNDAALFESWSVSSPQQPADQAHPEVPSRSSPQFPPEDSPGFDAPELRPLPKRGSSPSKSPLYSPMKPKWPGRVVEFSRSTTSMAAPLQALDASQDTAAPLAAISKPVQPDVPLLSKEEDLWPTVKPLPEPISQNAVHRRHHHQQQEQQQEPSEQLNHQRDIYTTLSQTQWSRDHWLLLNELLQEHREGAHEFQLRHSSALDKDPRKRPSYELLGKQVTSQGESMVLEQWQLDVVDVFKTEVGGWPEENVAKRLFALVVGEERRLHRGFTKRR